MVLSLWCIKTKFPILKMEPGEWKLHGKHIGILCKMGIPMGLQYSITAIGSVVLQTGINTLGSAAVASVSAASKLSMFLACPFDAIGSAMATYTGQNVGAGKIERIGQGLKASVLIGIDVYKRQGQRWRRHTWCLRQRAILFPGRRADFM